MKKNLLLFVLFFSLHGLAAAQNEQWDTYMVKMGNMPASVLVDMGLREMAPDRKYPFLVITGPKTRNCNSQGLPDNDEISILEDILGATGNFITGVTPKVLAGTVTRNCQRLNYYYVKDTTGIRNALTRMYTRSFKNYAYVLGMKAEPDWNTYRTFLFPDEETHNWMDNDKVISKMLSNGDSLKDMRDIRFHLVFPTDSNRAEFAAFAKKNGYNCHIADQASRPGSIFELEVSTVNKVKMETINPMTLELKREAAKHRGVYYGWEARPAEKK